LTLFIASYEHTPSVSMSYSWCANWHEKWKDFGLNNMPVTFKKWQTGCQFDIMSGVIQQ
jgi:hypothetical protein